MLSKRKDDDSSLILDFQKTISNSQIPGWISLKNEMDSMLITVMEKVVLPISMIPMFKQELQKSIKKSQLTLYEIDTIWTRQPHSTKCLPQLPLPEVLSKVTRRIKPE